MRRSPGTDPRTSFDRQTVNQQFVVDQRSLPHLNRRGERSLNLSQGGLIVSRLPASAKNGNSCSGGSGNQRSLSNSWIFLLFLQYSTCESGQRTHNEIGTSSACSALRQIESQRASRSRLTRSFDVRSAGHDGVKAVAGKWDHSLLIAALMFGS